jgi:hypothetical protein
LTPRETHDSLSVSRNCSIESNHEEITMPTASHLSAAQAAFELRFPSLSGAGSALSFPCDASGSVHMDSLSERALNNYLLARALTGRDYGWPSVLASRT